MLDLENDVHAIHGAHDLMLPGCSEHRQGQNPAPASRVVRRGYPGSYPDKAVTQSKLKLRSSTGCRVGVRVCSAAKNVRGRNGFSSSSP